MVGCSQGSVSLWENTASEGDQALSSKPHPGRPRRLTQRQHRRLEELLAQGAMSHGWSNDLWTCPRVKEVIRRQFGIDYHVDHVRKILVLQLGWTSQKPEKRARERDEEAIEEWRRKEFPRLKKTRGNGARRSYS